MRLLSIPMLSKKTVPILPPTSVLFASLSAQGSHVNGLHFLTYEHTFLSRPPAPDTGQGLAENIMFSSVLS